MSCKSETTSSSQGSDATEEQIKTESEELLEKAIEGNGGWANWKSLDTIQFYKTTKLYLEDGTIEDSTFQLHTYAMYPHMNGQYSYDKDGSKITVKYENGTISKLIDEKIVDLSAEESKKLKLGFLGAQFVMCLPYKLDDPGVILKKEEGTLEGKNVDIIKASYSTENSNHTKTHDWWHYVDKDNGKLLGYKVHHAPTYAQVINVNTTEIKGVSFPTYRKTYRVTKDDEKQFVRGEFWYEYL